MAAPVPLVELVTCSQAESLLTAVHGQALPSVFNANDELMPVLSTERLLGDEENMPEQLTVIGVVKNVASFPEYPSPPYPLIVISAPSQ